MLQLTSMSDWLDHDSAFTAMSQNTILETCKDSSIICTQPNATAKWSEQRLIISLRQKHVPQQEIADTIFTNIGLPHEINSFG